MMTKKEIARQIRQSEVLQSLGFRAVEAESLRRLSMALRRWYERECNGEVERDEETGETFHVSTYSGKRIGRCPDKERGAEKRLAAIMARVNAERGDHGALSTYLQSDPRGAALYIIRPGDVPKGESVGAYYSRGICVY